MTEPDAVRDGVSRGAYVVADSDAPQVQLLATGSEVSLALEAAAALEADGIATRVSLSTILSQAVEDEILPANPALRLGRYLRAGDEPKPDREVLTRGEVAHLLATAQEHFPRWHPLLLCALRTGLRQGELLGLRWADLDFTGGFIAVNQSIVRGVVTTPKNHRRRRVDMSAQLAATLKALRLESARPSLMAAGTGCRRRCSRHRKGRRWTKPTSATSSTACSRRPACDTFGSTTCATPSRRC